jgi:aminoglycoside phosphotransferase (APT) family kinase protein
MPMADAGERGRVAVPAVRIHEGEFEFDEALVRGLLVEQFPQWAELPLERVASSGTDNAIYRLGARLAVRLPRVPCSAGQTEKDLEWLPKLAPQLPLALPVPLALGHPGRGFPWTWGVYEWIDGASARLELLADACECATQLAEFVLALRRVELPGGPGVGAGRGRPLSERDAQVREAIGQLEGEIDVAAVTRAWEQDLKAPLFAGAAQWTHGDLLPGNLVVGRDGRLSAVIDWACLGLADPACDLITAWSLFTGTSREAFRERLGVDDGTWARGRGWALSVALIQLPYYLKTNPGIVEIAFRIVDAVVADCARVA